MNIPFLKKAEKTNVIMILLDMVRFDKRDTSEVFQELLKDGILFSEMISYAPYTIASLHAILTGMYGSRTNVDAYYKGVRFDKENCKTLAQHLKEAGYNTFADFMNEGIGPHQGFDRVSVYDEDKDDLLERHKKLIKEVSVKEPFFLYLHYSIIHREIVKNVIKKYGDFDEDYFNNRQENEKRFEEYVAIAGRYMSEIFSFIKQNKLLKNTLLVVLTDHGCSTGEKRGEKAYGIFAYDYTLKVWAYFIYPRLLPKNKETKILVRTVDIAPTILDILGIIPKEGTKTMQGWSLYPIIKGQDYEDREAYAETAGLDGPHPSHYEPNIFCVRNKKWKLIYNSTTRQKELYDLEYDKDELNNLTGKYPDIEQALFDKIKKRDVS